MRSEELRRILENVVEEIKLGDDVGIMLSGGLDSSAIACLILNKGHRLRAISASFKGYDFYDESYYVEKIKEKYPLLEVNYVTPLRIDLIEELKNLLNAIKKPITSGSPLLQYFIMKKAKELGLKSIIYCQWPDELLAGYDYFLPIKAKEDLKKLRFRQAYINIKEYIYRSKKIGEDKIYLRIIYYILKSSDLLDEVKKRMNGVLELIDIANNTAKIFGLNLIMPYGDRRFIEFSKSLNSDELVYDGYTKLILRKAVQDIVPKEIIERKVKFGFFAPEKFWLLDNKENLEKIESQDFKKEFEKFLKNPNRRFYPRLWYSLSKYLLEKDK